MYNYLYCLPADICFPILSMSRSTLDMEKLLFFIFKLFNPFIFIKSKRRDISSEGFSAREKNALICSQRAMLPAVPIQSWYVSRGQCCPHSWYDFRGQCCPSSWVWQPAADNSSCLAHFKFKKSAQNGNFYLPRAVIPDQITQQNSLQRAGGP